MKVDLRKSQKDIAEKVRELKEELTTKKKKVLELETSVKFISDSYDKLKEENEEMKNQIVVLEADNTKLSETTSKAEDGGEVICFRKLTKWTISFEGQMSKYKGYRLQTMRI